MKNHFNFNLSESILFVGEGNFSFSSSIANLLHDGSDLTCTCFDSKEILLQKYPDAIDHLELLSDLEAHIMYSIDATKLHELKCFKSKRFLKIIFNFPHVGAGIKDQDRNIRKNQELLVKFFSSASKKLETNGSIFVTLKQGLPYDEWEIKKQAKIAGLDLQRSFEFDPLEFPGYEHRRTLGFEPGISKSDNYDLKSTTCRTFEFILREYKQELDKRPSKKKMKLEQDAI